MVAHAKLKVIQNKGLSPKWFQKESSSPGQGGSVINSFYPEYISSE